MQVHLSSGGYDIIASGNAFVFGETEELTIHIIIGGTNIQEQGQQFKLLSQFLNDL